MTKRAKRQTKLHNWAQVIKQGFFFLLLFFSFFFFCIFVVLKFCKSASLQPACGADGFEQSKLLEYVHHRHMRQVRQTWLVTPPYTIHCRQVVILQGRQWYSTPGWGGQGAEFSGDTVCGVTLHGGARGLALCSNVLRSDGGQDENVVLLFSLGRWHLFWGLPVLLCSWTWTLRIVHMLCCRASIRLTVGKVVLLKQAKPIFSVTKMWN